MIVKWHNVRSSLRNLPGGSPQGASLGIWSFLSQTNDNPENTDSDNIFKFVDDKTFIEVKNIFSIGMASHNVRSRVPSNIQVSNIFIPSEHLKTQDNMVRVDEWTEAKQMKLNVKKTKNMMFNFTKNYQFSTDINLKGEIIETVDQTKLLGTYITSDLKWNKNTDAIVKETNKRMRILHKAVKFTNNYKDLKQIYMLQIRSKLDQSAVVWHSSLSKRNRSDLERVQKSALKCILGDKYESYNNALQSLKIQSLEERREAMCLKFAKQCVKLDKMKKLFPRNVNAHKMNKRSTDIYQEERANTERLKKSAIPAMQRLLNREELRKRVIHKKIDNFVPVNFGSCGLYHCDDKNYK